MTKMGIILDIREYKFKNFNCQHCKVEIKQKVQAEVDVTIAIKMIEYGNMPSIKTLTLFAGDRDFFDAIQYTTNVLGKRMELIAFEDTVSSRLTHTLNLPTVFLNKYWEPLTYGPDALSQLFGQPKQSSVDKKSQIK